MDSNANEIVELTVKELGEVAGGIVLGSREANDPRVPSHRSRLQT